MIFLAFLLFGVLFLLGASANGFHGIWLFLDVPSFLYVLLGVAGFFLLFGRKEFVRGVRTFFAFSYPQDEYSPESGQFYLRLTTFTLTWGLIGLLSGMVLLFYDFQPESIGTALAFCLLSFMYASVLALFVFLPIGIRLSPPTLPLPISWRFSVWYLFIGLGTFYLIRCIGAILALALAHFAQQPDIPMEPVFPNELRTIVYRAANLPYNPVDPQWGPFQDGFSAKGILSEVFLYIDVASWIVMVGSVLLFWMASGRIPRWIMAPVVILLGLFWSILGLVIMLSDVNPETIGSGFSVTMLTTLYAFVAAIGFLIVDMTWSGWTGNYTTSQCSPPLSSPAFSESVEQAKEILDRTVENERR